MELLIHNQLSVISAALLAVGTFVCLFDPGFPIGSSVLLLKGGFKTPFKNIFFFEQVSCGINHA